MVEKLTIKDLTEKGISELKKGDYNNPLLDVHLMLCHILNVDRIYLYTNSDVTLDNEKANKFIELLNKRKEGYPLQYILNTQEFMGLDFFVDEGVLIPRPDTEVLVENIIDIVKKDHLDNTKTIKIIDIGTGSGAITLSLANYIKNSFVYSVDISKKALEIANKNCNNLGLNNKVMFLEGDLLDKIDGNVINNVDVIVSNPPYIPSGDIDELQIEVSKYEPRLALDGGIDGLDFYKRIINKAPLFLKSNGLLAFEIGYNQGSDLSLLLKESKQFKGIKTIKDLGGKDRVILARKI